MGRGDGGVHFQFKAGRGGLSHANLEYITRPGATGQTSASIHIQNYPAYACQGESYEELRLNLVEYARQRDEDERRTARQGRGERQTHFRVIMSFEGKVVTETARELVREYVEKQFPRCRVIAVIHQNTPFTHAHIHIQARDIGGKKLRFTQSQWRTLHRGWAPLYERHDREQGGHRRLVEQHERKIEETREWKRDLARGIERPAPDRVPKMGWEEIEARRARARYELHESRTPAETRKRANRESEFESRERTIAEQPSARDRAIAEREYGIEPERGPANEIAQRGETEDQYGDRATRQIDQSEDPMATRSEREPALTPGEREAREAVQTVERTGAIIERTSEEIAERSREIEAEYKKIAREKEIERESDRAQCRSYS